MYSYAGATGDLIHYIAESNKYDGIVIAGTGAGRFSKKEKEALIYAAEKECASPAAAGSVVDECYRSMNLSKQILFMPIT